MYIKDLKKISSISRICFETPCKSRTYLNQHVSSKCFICYSLNYQGYIKFLLKSASFLIAVFSILELENRQIEENGKVFSQIPTFLWFHQYYEANSIEFKILHFKWRIFPYFEHQSLLSETEGSGRFQISFQSFTHTCFGSKLSCFTFFKLLILDHQAVFWNDQSWL